MVTKHNEPDAARVSALPKAARSARTYARRPVAAGWMTPNVRGATAAELLREIPSRYRKRPESAEFTEHVAFVVARVRGIRAKDLAKTPGDICGELQAVSKDAHALQNTLSKLGDGSDTFEVLATHADYLVWRARTRSAEQSARPAMPALHGDVPDLQSLLVRLDADLSLLRTFCEHATGIIKPDRNPPRRSERMLARMLVEAYVDAHGSLPKPRGWFEPFAKHVAEQVEPGMTLGHEIIGDVVAELSAV